jgi:molecular chaperone GrpE
VTNHPGFFDKLKKFVLGPSIPVLGQRDLENLDALNQHLERLARLESHLSGLSSDQLQPAAANVGQQPATVMEELVEQVRKLGKTQFKANTLQETQLAQQQETLESLQKTVARQEELIARLAQQQEQAVREARLELLKSLLPVVDSLQAAFDSGRRQVLHLPMSRATRQALIAWLDGLRLARLRLLDLLAAHQVAPIPAVGQAFDPHRHVAVATDDSGRVPDGVIVGEDRRGYATPDRVLRFAEVIVARSAGHKAPATSD